MRKELVRYGYDDVACMRVHRNHRAKMLAGAKKLEELDMGNNRLGPLAAAEFTSLLRNGEGLSLRKLLLGFNPFGLKAATANDNLEPITEASPGTRA